ncbi:MAG: hypothetical protein ACTSR2_08595 [Candidatus Hodarchaeales archaeon]
MTEVRLCKWKQGISGRSPSGEIQPVQFPCRYPKEALSTDLCTLCLLGELFSVFYAQTMNMKKSAEMQEEIMAFLKNFTSEDFDLR